MISPTYDGTSPETARRLRLRPAGDPERSGAKTVGIADAGPARPVGLAVADARHHIHVAGHTGGGKSTVLLNMILADARAGRGVAVLDPKGDLVTDVLDRLPLECAERLVIIDPAEHTALPALNVLGQGVISPELATEHLVGVLHRIFADAWGPRIEDTLRAALRTLATYEWASLADVPLLLTEGGFRRQVTAQVRRDDPEGLGGFWDAYNRLSPAQIATVGGGVLSKLRAVLGRSFVADLFGSAASSFAVSDILDGGILLARLPKGLLGDDAARLVGALLLSALWQAATARVDVPEVERQDASVYVDEAHNFLHLPIGLDDVLAEARGYRLSFVLAHQHLGQLPRAMAEALHANARNKIFFAVSPTDAKELARHVGPYLLPEDLIQLERFHIACRLVAGGANTTGFTLATQPSMEPVLGRADRLRNAARTRGLTRATREQLRRQRRIRTVTGGISSGTDSPAASPSGSPSGPEPAGEPDTSASMFPQFSPIPPASKAQRDWPL